MKATQYTPDILQNGFEQATLSLNDDYEGKTVATLIRRQTNDHSEKAILYVHGFNDYFFQEEMAFRFNQSGYNFYALDLRKYGRSYRAHQKFNDIRNVKNYYEEILYALQVMQEEGNKSILLLGHSTGGLILTLFAKDNTGIGLYDGLILNSPFYEFNQSKPVRMMLPLISFLGGIIPSPCVSGGFTEQYGHQLHKKYSGDWDYDLEWKPNIAPKVNLGWIRAIHQAQRELKKKFRIEEPVLVMHSAKSVEDMENLQQIRTRDAILNVEHIKQIAGNIEGPVQITPIKGGIHDLFLSEKGVRERVYDTVNDWLRKNNL